MSVSRASCVSDRLDISINRTVRKTGRHRHAEHCPRSPLSFCCAKARVRRLAEDYYAFVSLVCLDCLHAGCCDVACVPHIVGACSIMHKVRTERKSAKKDTSGRCCALPAVPTAGAFLVSRILI